MKAYLKDEIIYINLEDLPIYKKSGSNVRNSYFWALKSIACHTSREKDWEFDSDVWIALTRILISFSQSGYLRTSETILEFSADEYIPEALRPVSSRI